MGGMIVGTLILMYNSIKIFPTYHAYIEMRRQMLEHGCYNTVKLLKPHPYGSPKSITSVFFINDIPASQWDIDAWTICFNGTP